MDTKQVIVIRKDLNMRKGKMVAQGAHASMAVLLDQMLETHNTFDLTLYMGEDSPVHMWLSNSFTKIVVGVDSEEELETIYNNAKKEGVPAALIEDSGATEFNGVPTKTAVAIGPWYSTAIDEITGHLKLL